MRTYTIELRADFDDEEKFEIIKGAMKTAAKHVYTSAMLIQDKRAPQIALYGSDFFSSAEEISLAEDIPEVNDESPTDQDAGVSE